MELFLPFKPMEPKLAEGKEVFPQANYIYQIKWDGVRGIIHISKDEVKVFNKKMRDKTRQYPELQIFKDFGEELILDGEIVAFKEGVPSFTSVIKRDFAIDKKKIKTLHNKLPVVYCVFDILYFRGKSLINLGWQERKKYLTHLITKDFSNIHLTEDFENGKELFTAVKKKNMEGIVAKKKNSIYELGVKSENWRKIKYRRQQYCVVLGYTIKNLSPSALLLGLYNDTGQLVYVGRAGSGLSGEVFQELIKGTKDMVMKAPIVTNPPKERLTYVWLEPKLTVLVEYAEITDDFSLRAPVIKAFHQVDPKLCKF